MTRNRGHSSSSRCTRYPIIYAGWWLSPTPLKNNGVRQLGWWNSQSFWKVIKFHGSSHHQPVIYDIPILSSVYHHCCCFHTFVLFVLHREAEPQWKRPPPARVQDPWCGSLGGGCGKILWFSGAKQKSISVANWWNLVKLQNGGFLSPINAEFYVI